MFFVKQIMEKTLSHSSELYLVFLDLKKAYNNVLVQRLWVAMKDCRVKTIYKKQLTVLMKIRKSKIETKRKSKIRKELIWRVYGKWRYKPREMLVSYVIKIYLSNDLMLFSKLLSMGVQLKQGHIFNLSLADDQAMLVWLGIFIWWRSLNVTWRRGDSAC